ncbi:hypothetical protein [Candidatus Leptofilum sp.]|uniref:hypothetical protein n=1 Tax=Candidatus Leptofilum sp. TaxID=3241576 RepID=UPI003B5BAC6E
MRDITKTIDTFWAMLLLTVMLVGSPLASFGCQTIIPDQFQPPCETGLGETAVQSNFVQPVTNVITLTILLTIFCWLRPHAHAPQELFLQTPSPPPKK